jgi:hypothetical protein
MREPQGTEISLLAGRFRLIKVIEIWILGPQIIGTEKVFG